MQLGSGNSERFVLGLDIGGTKLAVGLVDFAGKVVWQKRVPTRAAEGPEAVLSRLFELSRTVVSTSQFGWEQVVAAGIGCGGPIESGIVKGSPNLPGWVCVPVEQRVAQELGVPAFLDNDANAAALGEHLFGAGRGVQNIVYLTISTGIGGGVICNGHLYHGENGNAGEIGHMVVIHGGRHCKCGQKGCLEAYTSGTSIADRARERVLAGAPSLLLDLAGGAEAITAETVYRALQLDDSLACEIWQETVEILGSGLASVINLFNPRLVVLGGGITNFGDWLFKPVRQIALSSAMHPLAKVVNIVPAQLGGDVGIVGAAAVALNRLGLP